MESLIRNGLKQPNIERPISACHRQKLDRVPNWEEWVDKKIVSYILDKDAPDSCDLNPDDAVEFAFRTYQDAIWLHFGIQMGDNGTICSFEDIDKWQSPEPVEFRNRILQYCKALENTSIGLSVGIFGPFMQTFMAMGPVPIQSFFLNLYDNSELVEYMLDKHTEANLKLIDTIIDSPIDFFYLADDICDANGYMCSPDIMHKLWVPRMEKVVNALKQKGVPIMWHCCGKLDDILPLLIEWGIDVIEPVQASCNDIYELKEKFGSNIAFRGNIEVESVLTYGTCEEVREDTKKHIEKLCFDGGYIVSSSHSIVSSIPPENYLAMIDAAIEFGAY